MMDRAVRRSREQYWCDIFDRYAPAIFGVPQTHVVDSDGFSCRGLDKDGFNKEGFDGDGFNREGRNTASFDKEGYDAEGFNRRGMNKDGFDKQGRDMLPLRHIRLRPGWLRRARPATAGLTRLVHHAGGQSLETDSSCHDGYGQSRPKETPKKSVTGKNSDKLSS